MEMRIYALVFFTELADLVLVVLVWLESAENIITVHVVRKKHFINLWDI